MNTAPRQSPAEEYPDIRNPHIFGAGLRSEHFTYLLEKPRTRIEWFEAISENFMNSRGRPLSVLETIRRDYPVALHGVSLSIASTDGLDPSYTGRLADLVSRIDPFLVSDHLCFSRYGEHYLHDLLPFPLTERALDVVAHNVDRLQSFLGCRIALENASVYLSYPGAEMSEPEFLRLLVQRTGCGVLLDLNNLYVNQRNVGQDPAEYFDRLPAEAILQLHLGGYSDPGTFYFDTHSAPVYEPVWQLYEKAMRLYPMVPVCIEWDENVPEFTGLEEEVDKARSIRNRVMSESRDYIGSLSEGKDRVPVRRARSEGTMQREQNVPAAPDLESLQRSFRNLLHNGEERFEADILPAGEMEYEDALYLYASGYEARRVDVLAENHRSTMYLLGKERFYEQVQSFIAKVHSHEFDLNRFGQYFASFLAEQPDDVLLILASCCAVIDRTFLDVFHREAGANSVADISGINGDSDFYVILNPSLVLIHSPAQVYDLWKAGFHRESVEEESTEGPAISDTEVRRRLTEEEWLAVYRREDGVFVLPLLPWQYRMLEAIQNGSSLFASIELCEDEIPDTSALSGFFQSVASERIMSGFQPR